MCFKWRHEGPPALPPALFTHLLSPHTLPYSPHCLLTAGWGWGVKDSKLGKNRSREEGSEGEHSPPLGWCHLPACVIGPCAVRRVGLFQAAQGVLGLSIPVLLFFRTHNGPGFSSECPSDLLLPVHYGAIGRAPGPQSQWTTIPRWHQWTGLHQWDTCESGLPCSCNGLPRHETSAALPRGASAGKSPAGGRHQTGGRG